MTENQRTDAAVPAAENGHTASIVAGLPPIQPVSRQLGRKIETMEQAKGRNHPLTLMRGWLEAAGLLPEAGLRIQIAGTNGKGSVSRWLSLFFQQTGHRVLTFTSPHLLQHFERIMLDGQPIPAADWEALYDTYVNVFAAKQMTMFEMDLWMALAYTRQVRPDVLIMEVGMGGERDATTALDYDWSLITNIGMDHMAYLGDTKEEITAAKAGIIQSGVPVWTTETDPVCLQILQQKARAAGAPFSVVQTRKKDWPEGLPAYQNDNFSLAKAAWTGSNYAWTPELEQRVLAQFMWPARFTKLAANPLIVLDGAHNLPGIEALCRSLTPGQFACVYFSVLADKQAAAMITCLRAMVPHIVLVQFDTSRLADLEQLALQENLPLISFAQMMQNLQTTTAATLICGSLYFAGEVLAAWKTCPSSLPE